MDNSSYIDSFIQFLSQIKTIDDNIKIALKERLIVKHIPKDTRVLERGEVCSSAYFVVEGLGIVRVEHGFNKKINEKLREEDSVSRFSPANSLLMSPVSFYQQKPSNEIIETLEDSIFIEFGYDSMQFMYENFPDFNYIGRELTEKYFILSEKRAYILRNHTGEEKWAWFKLNYPFLLNGRITQHDIAKFLGMSREYLNKIRKKSEK